MWITCTLKKDNNTLKNHIFVDKSYIYVQNCQRFLSGEWNKYLFYPHISMTHSNWVVIWPGKIANHSFFFSLEATAKEILSHTSVIFLFPASATLAISEREWQFNAKLGAILVSRLESVQAHYTWDKQQNEPPIPFIWIGIKSKAPGKEMLTHSTPSSLCILHIVEKLYFNKRKKYYSNCAIFFYTSIMKSSARWWNYWENLLNVLPSCKLG